MEFLCTTKALLGGNQKPGFTGLKGTAALHVSTEGSGQNKWAGLTLETPR